MMKGIEKLTDDQIELIKKINTFHTNGVGNEYKDGMQITEVWLNKNDILCVRLKNGEWFHYLEDGTWY